MTTATYRGIDLPALNFGELIHGAAFMALDTNEFRKCAFCARATSDWVARQHGAAFVGDGALEFGDLGVGKGCLWPISLTGGTLDPAITIRVTFP